jgi:hypothetical protein
MSALSQSALVGRVLPLMRFRLRPVLAGRHLLAPLVALAAVQLVGLSGGGAPAALCVTTAILFALPLLSWAARQVLDAEPDEQVRISTLAVGGSAFEVLAGLLASYAVVAPLAVLCAAASLLHVNGEGVPTRDALVALALALAAALAAVAIGSLASRSVAGTGGGSVIVLVVAPVLVVVVGLSRNPAVAALVPCLDDAVRAAYEGRLAAVAPVVVAQVVLWSVVVLALRLALRRD